MAGCSIWLGIGCMLTDDSSCNVVKCIGLISYGKQLHECLHSIWLVSTWSI